MNNPSAKLLAEIWEGQLKIPCLPLQQRRPTQPNHLDFSWHLSHLKRLLLCARREAGTQQPRGIISTLTPPMGNWPGVFVSRIWKFQRSGVESTIHTYLHGVFLSIYAVLWAREVFWLVWESPVQMEFYCLEFPRQASSSDFRGCI